MRLSKKSKYCLLSQFTHFCPSCHQKRVVEFGEWLCEQVIKAVPHRHFIFSVPKILRRYFLYDRSLLSELSHCGWPPARRAYAPEGSY